MTFRTDLKTFVDADAGIQASLGTSPVRFYWQQLPEGVTYPAARYFIVSRPPNTAHDGPSGLETAVVQIDIVGPDAAAIETAAEAFKTAMNGKRATVNNIKGMILQSEIDSFEDADNLMRIVHSYLIHHGT